MVGKNLATCEGQSMFESDPVMSICADASLSGWGAECNGLRTGMTWSQEEARRHINELELLGAFNALRSFAAFRKNCTVELRLDNTTAVAYITEEEMKEEHRLVMKVTPPLSLSKKLPDFGN